MYLLNVEKRDQKIKAKNLRATGQVPGNVYGGTLTETISIQIPQKEAKKLLKTKAKGGRVQLHCDEKKFNVIIKEINLSPIYGDIENVSFQQLEEDKVITATAQIILLNKEKIPVMIQQFLSELPYKALPSHLVEEIEIDMEGRKAGSCIKVEDLSIAKDPEIELLLPLDSLVLNLVEHSRAKNQLSEADDT